MANVPDMKTAYEKIFDHHRVHCHSGDFEKPEYQPVYDKAGVWHLEPTGKLIHTYLEIQAYADECDMNTIMRKYALGDTDVLSRIQGTYGDVSRIPTNYAELMNAKLEAERLFYGLAAEVREKYNNSVEQFMAEIGTKEGMEKLGLVPEAVPAAAPADQKEGVEE